MAKTPWAQAIFPTCSLFGRRKSDAAAASIAAAPVVPESPRSQPSFEAERAQYAEDVGSLTSEKAKQQASACTFNPACIFLSLVANARR